MSALKLKIVTPEGIDQTFDCDSVILWMAADSEGREEGCIGIRKGHTGAVIALGNGPLKASLAGEMVYTAQTQGGFATVIDDIVTVVTPHISSI